MKTQPTTDPKPETQVSDELVGFKNGRFKDKHGVLVHEFDVLKVAFKEAMEQMNKHKDDVCANPPHPFDWAHSYENKTFYHTDEKENGYTASICRKCGYQHPGSVTYFAKLQLPLKFEDKP